MTSKLVTGSGAAADITELQKAVNEHDEVRLKGTFDFTGLGSGAPKRVITINRSVRIRVETGESVNIIGGERPFLVSQAGAVVSFEGLNFEKAKAIVISALAAADLTISSCTIKGVFPVFNPAVSLVVATAIGTSGITGNLRILNNTIDVGGGIEVTANDSTSAMVLTGPTTRIEITGNTIKNTTGHGIDVRSATGDALIENNTITTGALGRDGSPGKFSNAVRCVGSGNYVVQLNKLDFGFENGAGVRLGGTSRAVVTQNQISMSSQQNAVLGPESAGIQLRGTSEGNRIEDNRIIGRARVALAAVHSDFPLDKPNHPDGTASSGNPVANRFVQNHHSEFNAGFADIEVGSGALETVIAARQAFADDARPPRPHSATDAAETKSEKDVPATPAGGTGTGVATAVGVSAGSDALETVAPVAGTVADFGTDTKILGRYLLIA
jgi:hypothetical protein